MPDQVFNIERRGASMSIVGILGSNLFSGVISGFQGTQGAAPKFEQIKEQFQQLGQDLQSGNLTQAQTDYATLSKEFPGANQASANAAATAATTTATTTATTNTTPTTTGATSVAQQFAQLGQDLQSGNLQAAQQDYTNLQQTAQQNGAQQVGGHHRGHHHHGGDSQSASSTSSSSSSSSQTNPIAQAFSTLSQDLQAGNLSGAQSAFATLQNDLQQIGGFAPPGSGGTSPTSTGTGSSTGGNLNVSA
jgi:outer membrane protein assembly factor BamD (BamD/ComL family)